MNSKPISSTIFVALYLMFATSGIAQSNDDRLRAQQHLSTGNVLLQKGNVEQAAVEFGKVIEFLPNLAIGYINRGLAYAYLGKHAEALADAEKALAVAENGPSQKVYQGMAHQVRGHVFYSQREYQRSIEAYSSGIELEPVNAKYHNGRGLAYMALGEYEQALRDFGKTIELDPKLAQPYVNRSVVHRRMKDNAAAIRDLDVALSLDPSNAGALSNRAANYLDLKKYDEAISDFSKAIALEPKWEFFYNRGRAYMDKGDFQRSIDDNTEAIRRGADSYKPLHNRAIAHHRLGKNQLAIDDLRKALSVSPSSSAHYNLAYILYRSGKFSEASVEASKLIAKFPAWRAPVVLRGESYAKLGNTARANADRLAASKLSAAWKPSEDGFFILDLDIDVR